jgi:hypothetical protein
VEEKEFALKGGTAINLFFRDMPRLSVDLDLAFVPVADRVYDKLVENGDPRRAYSVDELPDHFRDALTAAIDAELGKE